MPTALTLQHRAAQLAIRAIVFRNVLAVVPAFDLRNIDETWDPVERGLLGVVSDGRSRSVAATTSYYSQFRDREGLLTPLPSITLPAWEGGAVASLRVVGPVMAKAAILAKRPTAAEDTVVRIAGAATRHALDGGRTALGLYVRKDRGGWRRVTSGRPCDFCAMLRDRGAVYGKETVHFRSHDHCSCVAEPVFRRNAA